MKVLRWFAEWWFIVLVWVALFVMILACVTLQCQEVRGGEFPDCYNQARAEAMAKEKPLVVLVGAEWCAPCKEAEKQYGAQLRQQGVYVHLDKDRHAAICNRILPGNLMIPALLVYRRVNHDWQEPSVYVGLPAIAAFLKR